MPNPARRFFYSLFIPAIAGVLLTVIAGLLFGNLDPVAGQDATTALLLGGLGFASLILGVRWYGLTGLGLRGGRALYAGIGFATLGWIVLFLARFLVPSDQTTVVAPGFGRIFVYLFLFEALAVQLWVFGLVFRSLADLRGALTAAVTTGLLFASLAVLFFQESFITTVPALFFFSMWGVFYGVIRLRTGSILGIVVVQAMQTLTVWYILLPAPEPPVTPLQNMYLIVGTLVAVFIWRLWPGEEADYRV